MFAPLRIGFPDILSTELGRVKCVKQSSKIGGSHSVTLNERVGRLGSKQRNWFVHP